MRSISNKISPLVYIIISLFILSSCSDSGKQSRHGKRKSRPHLVEVYTVKPQPIIFTVTRTGTIGVKRIVKLFSQEEGEIKTLSVYESDKVEKGQLLVKINDDILTAELKKASATREQARQNLARNKRLSRRRLVSEDLLVKAQTEFKIASAEEMLLKTRVANTSIIAPFSGIISKRHAEPGDVVTKHQHILTIIDPATYMIKVKISELLIPNYSVGDQVDIQIDALGSKIIKGTIDRIFPTIDTETRQGTLKIKMIAIPSGVKTGQLCRITLTSAPRPGLSVPFNSLQRDKNGEFILAITDGKAKRINVRSGLRHGSLVEIRSGLTPETVVVTRGFLGLRPGKKVVIVNPNTKRKRSHDRSK